MTEPNDTAAPGTGTLVWVGPFAVFMLWLAVDKYLPLANPLYKIGRTIGVLERDSYRWVGNAIKPGEKLAPRAVDGEVCIVTEVSLLTLGEVQIACIPGEIYPEIVIGGVPDPAYPGADFPNAPV